jgi:tRNA modification GTPase
LHLAILEMQLSADGDASDIFISRSRHIECIRMALASINEIIEFCIQPNDPAIASHYLRECINSIGEIAGTVVNEEIMNDIFSQFCIGK